MHSILLIGYVLAGWKWGDWRNWEKYYPTILFFLIGDLLYNFLLYNYPMWSYHPSFDKQILPNHTMISLAIEFLSFPVKVLIYLGHYPAKKSKAKQGFYILAWVVSLTVFELIARNVWGGLSHHHGWNILWTFLFYIVIFGLLRLHQIRPLLTWVISFWIITFLLIYFKVPIEKMK
ncbi:CBO0543 family protein [Neobacillus muris]|uniref:CBO0543 family protein n=1 Tax=Neobacillus muris TaxID=2941334 RepID=UPI002041CF8D|nr:CBO0543 family protein [Neobacillus muris]